MKKMLRALAIVCLSLSSAVGGAITSTTTAVGVSYTAVIGNSNVAASDLTNSFVIANFSDGSEGNCLFGIGTGSCIDLPNFSLAITPPTSQTNSATWTIVNLKTPGIWMTSIDINVLVGTKPVGFDDGSIVGSQTGTSPATAAALLTDALHLFGQPTSPAPEYARLVLVFTTAPGLRLDGAQAWGFGAANHNITTFTPDVTTPEPATYGLIGLALASFGAFKFGRRSC